jgi:SAM-dependent methyltransferase
VRRSAQVEPLEPITLGDPALAEVAAQALTRTGPVERGTHGFHTWPAGLHPDAARDLVAALPGTSVLDPFCGGGTVLVEARLAGRAAYGRDLSPVALIVARGRCATWDEARLTRVRSAARRLAEAARSADELPPEPIRTTVKEWYAAHVACELESLRTGIAACDRDIQPALWLCFSSILVKTSYRQSDTSAQKVRHDRPAGTTAILFHKKVREHARQVTWMRENVPAGTREVDLDLQDARGFTARSQVDLVLTSPPYPSTYDYLPMQHLRSVWMGLDAGGEEIGARRYWRQGAVGARRRWRDDTEAWSARAAAVLRPGGHLVVVIGDGLTPSGPIDASAPTEDAAKAAGLRSVARASIPRVDHARETVRWEHCFVFAKPGGG